LDSQVEGPTNQGWNWVYNDPQKPWRFVKKKNGKYYYLAYKVKGNEYKHKTTTSLEELDTNGNPVPASTVTKKTASIKDPEADKDTNEVDILPPGGKMKKVKGKDAKQMMWKINGNWLNETAYLEYVSAKDPHNTEKYWKMT